MKVIFNTYPSAFQTPGGGEIQMIKTKEYLEKNYKKIKIDFFNLFTTLSDYDILHNFSLNRDTFNTVKLAKHKNIKIVISPIYWPPNSLLVEKLGIIKATLFLSLKKIGEIFSMSTLSWEKEMLRLANMILPNSKIEADVLMKQFNISNEKIRVIYNGVDKWFLYGDENKFREKYNVYDDFILYVGRIEERKNLIRLIKATKELDIPLVVIGPKYTNDSYYLKCMRYASKKTIFIGKMEHYSEDLRNAYAASKVFALPSMFETPGLSALEAGLAGSNILITSRGSTREYFDDYAWYVDPFSYSDIKKNLLDAYLTDKSDKLKRHIYKNFLWNKIAKDIMNVYKMIVD